MFKDEKKVKYERNLLTGLKCYSGNAGFFNKIVHVYSVDLPIDVVISESGSYI